ncbi:MAG: HAD-IIIC family phosphatase, partial [Bacteroidota bacterium]|nr:HAD-IIIC family phosphatase [Bacteroidota bacterium]
MLEFTRLKNNLKKPTDGFSSIRLAVLCDHASQHLVVALKGDGIDRKTIVEIYEADYNQIEQQVFDKGAALYSFEPEVVLLSKSTHKLLDDFYATPVEERHGFAQKMIVHFQTLMVTMQERLKTTIILTNFLEVNDGVFGNYANNVAVSFLYQVRKLNLLLMEESQKQKGLLIADVQSLISEAGLLKAVDQKNLVKADLIWSLEFLPTVARTIIGLIEATLGKIKKCIVLDLDNTLWGGVIGDDGLEGIQIGDFGIGKAFSRFQKWIKELKRRGIIVCICSKNNETVAKEVFEKHPDTILGLDDIAVFAANWNNKVDNLHFIKNALNIGFDAMVFIDDNPFERGMVKEGIPELEVPEMPEDPVDYLPFLQSLNLFETVSYTSEDEHRTVLYKQEAERVTYQHIYKNEEEYLAGLQMIAEIKSLDAFTLPRAAQLSQRSNQFNLRTIRYNEAELKSMILSADYFPFVVALKDRFGNYGVISFVVLKKDAENIFIENWTMSCRVLKRGVEK